MYSFAQLLKNDETVDPINSLGARDASLLFRSKTNEFARGLTSIFSFAFWVLLCKYNLESLTSCPKLQYSATYYVE
jgi:hypothetical protein